MKIGYKNRKLEKICTKQKDASRRLPQKIKSELLFLRLQQLAAFDNLELIPFQVPPLHFHPLREDLAGGFAITIRSLWRIVFEPAGDFEIREDGTADLSTVTEITITAVKDYHKK